MYKKLIVIAAVLVAVVGFATPVSAQSSNSTSEKNQTSYWEGQGYGKCVKYDNLKVKTFTVPAAPSGKVYTLAVIKAGSEQSTDEPHETDTTVKAGDVLQHSSGKDLSHVILCYKDSSSGGNNGGNNGGEVEGATDEEGSVLGASDQVDAPAAGVSAGFGGGLAGASTSSLAGVSASLLSLGYGLRRLNRRQ